MDPGIGGDIFSEGLECLADWLEGMNVRAWPQLQHVKTFLANVCSDIENNLGLKTKPMNVQINIGPKWKRVTPDCESKLSPKPQAKIFFIH